MKRKLLCLVLLLTLAIPFFAFGTMSVSASETHTVTFMLDENVEYETQTIDHDDYASVPLTPAPTQNGSSFVCWQLNGVKFSFATPITSDITLFAQWEEVETFYTVEFKADGKVISVQEVEEGSSAIAPANVICPEGMQFVGWDKSYDFIEENLTVNAILAPKTYLVQIMDGKEVFSTQQVKHGEDVILPAVQDLPKKEHYTFAGFDGETENITQDTIINITYDAEKFAVKFYSDDAEIDSQQVEYLDTVSFPEQTPLKVGYIFIGWYLDLDDVAMYNFSAKVEQSFDLYAKFIPIAKPKFEVKFYDGDGNQYGGTQRVEQGNSAIKPGDPYKEGHKFVGWSEDFNSITQNRDIYPIFELNTYVVTVVANGQVISTEHCKFGATATEPTEVPEIEGYDFIGWDASFKNVRSDMTITAKYRVKTFIVMFYNAEMKKLGGTQFVEYGKGATAPILAKKEGYEFIGWSDGENVSLDGYTNITKDVVFFAEYRINTYSVNFYEGTELKKTEQVEYGKGASLYTYEKDGFVFYGWFTDEDCTTPFSFTSQITENVNLYAKWVEEVKQTFSVVFKVDGAEYLTQSIVEGGKLIVPANPVKEGHTFNYWMLDESEFDFDTEIIEGLVLEANFSINSYVVTFKYGDGKQSSQTVVYNKAAVAPTDTALEGYEFVKWDKEFENVKGDMTINAVYEIKTYQVIFHNGQSTVDIQTVQHGKYANIVATPSQTGKKFVGWTYDDGSAFSFATPITEKTDVYAQFSVLSYKVYYYLDGVLYKTVEHKFGATITAIQDPTFDSEDTIFLGWSEIPETMPEKDIVVMGKTYTYRYYDVNYYIDGRLYYSEEVREGKPITVIDAPAKESLSETIVFIGWGEVPETMGKEDIRVDAQIKKLGYYKVYLYVGDVICQIMTILEGNTIPEPSAPVVGKDQRFDGWINLPEIMPANDVKVYAEIYVYKYYKVQYYVDGQIYRTVSVREGDAIVLANAPVGLDETIVFIRWGEIPETMGNEDIRVDAVIEKLSYYTITYYLNDQVYFVDRVLEGKKINICKAPQVEAGYEFSGWSEIPSVMPKQNLIVNGYINAMGTNMFELNEITLNGNTVITVSVKGNVNFAGVLARVHLGQSPINVIIHGDAGTYNVQNGVLTFVWSKGENTTEQTALITMTFVGQVQFNELLEISEIYAFSGNDVVSVDYQIISSNNQNKN